ncbi:hypothetical protein [Teredinibacter turnerae]|uniref:hypothetical protein n=1 Tax=Teredinibacter turnerae TaxID=2426 RepID=UPI0003A5EB89|nr:hypothetical protein [Teredinibacter turnerae]
MLIVVNKRHKTKPYGRGSHLSYLLWRLKRRAEVVEVSTLRSVFTLLLDGFLSRNSMKTTTLIIFPSSSVNLVLLPLARLVGVRTVVFSWRLGPPHKLLSRARYEIERFLIRYAGVFLAITSEQLDLIGSFSKKKKVMPPIVRRVTRFRGGVRCGVWCSGGADRNEVGFIEFCIKKNLRGFRTSADINILNQFALLLDDDIAAKFRIGDATELKPNPEIYYLDCINPDNPAGMTAFFDHFRQRNRFVLPSYIQGYATKIGPGEHEVTSSDIKMVVDLYDHALGVIISG